MAALLLITCDKFITCDVYKYFNQFIPMLLVTSTGAAAEEQGDCMGVFLLAGEHNNRPYYRQKHTLDTEGARFLYSHDIWYLGCE